MNAHAKLTIHEPGIQVKHHIWIAWAEIAIAQEASARAAREAAMAAHATGQDISPHIASETRAAMQGVAACAHAIDGLYGGVKTLIKLDQSPVTAWNANSAARHARIRETLARGFRLHNDVGKRWRKEFTWLFGLRDDEVHFEERFQSFVAHPVLPTQVSPVMAIYALESASRALELLFDVFAHTLVSGAGRTPASDKYARDMHATRARLLGLRSAR